MRANIALLTEWAPPSTIGMALPERVELNFTVDSDGHQGW